MLLPTMAVIELSASLKQLSEHPERLVPNSLLARVANPWNIRAFTLPPLPLGRLDDEITPSLTVGIVERGAYGYKRKLQEEDDPTQSATHNWARLLNLRRLSAINEGVLTEYDSLLILIIAHEQLLRGVHLINYVESQAIRSLGIGTSFFPDFGKLLAEAGFDYWWAQHQGNPRALKFFLERVDATPIDQVPFDQLQQRGVIIPRYQIHSENTIKFLN